MKNLALKVTSIAVLTLLSAAYVFPYSYFGMTDPMEQYGTFKLGLDLHGGVELDYMVDTQVALERKKDFTRQQIVEAIKAKVEERVNRLGTAEPTITSAIYGDEDHIIVQIPTPDFPGDLSEEEKALKNAEYIANAKREIGRVTRLEFKELRETITDSDREARKTLAQSAREEMNSLPFEVVGQKYADSYELVGFIPEGTGSLGAIEAPWKNDALKTAKVGDIVGPFAIEVPGQVTLTASGELQQGPGEKGYSIVKVLALTGAESASGAFITYQGLFISERPSQWIAAKTEDGKILDEQYLSIAGVDLSNGIPKVSLTFNEEGKLIFAELTKRLVGKQIAIYAGSTLLTAPTVREAITGGQATIDGQASIDEARALADGINQGIIPAPIYLTSERVIDAKIAANALEVIVHAGLIGLLVIIVWLIAIYRVSGLVAGIALVIYAVLLIALIKAGGLLLTLAAIAGVILSIGLAIDANILIFERTREELRAGKDILTAMRVGFDKSWSAIWDSHITSFTSAFVLWLVGVNLIKGFGLMLGLGILLSLFTAMWVSRVLLWLVGRRMSKNLSMFIGIKK